MVRQRHRLRRFFRSTGEQYHRRLVRISIHELEAECHPLGPHGQERLQPLPLADRFLEVLEEQGLGIAYKAKLRLENGELTELRSLNPNSLVPLTST